MNRSAQHLPTSSRTGCMKIALRFNPQQTVCRQHTLVTHGRVDCAFTPLPRLITFFRFLPRQAIGIGAFNYRVVSIVRRSRQQGTSSSASTPLAQGRSIVYPRSHSELGFRGMIESRV
ncbi:hypothetical protein J6590_040754 [Homalodisca vitripennis]|nr:hypothetical protein J6590_040754 [Homalodisca vitripennis]